MRIIHQFIDWWDIYETNLKLLDDVSARSRRVASWIELAAYRTSIQLATNSEKVIRELHNVTATGQSVL